MANTPLELYETAYRLHYNESKLSEAISYYEAIIKEFPESNECGYAAIQLQKIKANELVKAIEQRNKSLHPVTIIALVLSVFSFLMLAAVGSFTIYQLKVERQRTSLATRAIAKMEAGDYNEALKLLTQLKMIDKTDLMPFEITALIHRKQGQQEEAKTEYEIYYSLNPDKTGEGDNVPTSVVPESSPAQPKAAPKAAQQPDPFSELKEPAAPAPAPKPVRTKSSVSKPRSTGEQTSSDSISYF